MNETLSAYSKISHLSHHKYAVSLNVHVYVCECVHKCHASGPDSWLRAYLGALVHLRRL